VSDSLYDEDDELSGCFEKETAKHLGTVINIDDSSMLT
jgi:hypothetical protein